MFWHEVLSDAVGTAKHISNIIGAMSLMSEHVDEIAVIVLNLWQKRVRSLRSMAI
jgi:hypothetical protein